MSGGFEIAVLDAAEALSTAGQLADVLLDCVAGGASVSFMADLSKAGAAAFFRDAASAVARQELVLIAARQFMG